MQSRERPDPSNPQEVSCISNDINIEDDLIVNNHIYEFGITEEKIDINTLRRIKSNLFTLIRHQISMNLKKQYV